MRLPLAFFLLAAAASAQTAPVVLAPGHPDLDLADVAPQTQVVAVQMLAPQEQVMGTVRDDVRLDGGVLTVVTSTEVGMAGPGARDSTRMAWPSLAPVAHTLETDGQLGTVTYDSDAIIGTWGTSAAPSPIAFGLERPVFAPAALPYVIRALPLDRAGYRATVPLFSAKDRFQEATLTVVGPETITLSDGRTVEAVAVDQAGGGGLTRGFTQRHFVDPVTRGLVRTTLAPMGMSVQIDPLPAEVAATVRPIRARPAQPPVALVPGHPDLRADEITLGEATSEMRRSMPERQSLWHIEETAQVEDGVATVVMRAEQTNADAPQTLRDTVRVAWPSLAPLAHRRVTTTADGDAVSALSFDGLHVTGVYGQGQPLDLDLAAPVFGPRSVALVVRALPFQAGYLATLSTFTSENRLQTHTLIVVGREPVETPDGPVSAWIVEHEGDGPTRRYAVHPDTRELLSMTYSPTLGSVIETVRL